MISRWPRPEYPLYGGGDDEVKEAIIEKLWDDYFELLILTDRMNAYREELERAIKAASKKISLR